jgi:hypothetical protein
MNLATSECDCPASILPIALHLCPSSKWFLLSIFNKLMGLLINYKDNFKNNFIKNFKKFTEKGAI